MRRFLSVCQCVCCTLRLSLGLCTCVSVSLCVNAHPFCRHAYMHACMHHTPIFAVRAAVRSSSYCCSLSACCVFNRSIPSSSLCKSFSSTVLVNADCSLVSDVKLRAGDREGETVSKSDSDSCLLSLRSTRHAMILRNLTDTINVYKYIAS